MGRNTESITYVKTKRMRCKVFRQCAITCLTISTILRSQLACSHTGPPVLFMSIQKYTIFDKDVVRINNI